jgi:hypothetical protein
MNNPYRPRFISRRLSQWVRALSRTPASPASALSATDQRSERFRLETFESRVLLSADLGVDLKPLADPAEHGALVRTLNDDAVPAAPDASASASKAAETVTAAGRLQPARPTLDAAADRTLGQFGKVGKKNVPVLNATADDGTKASFKLTGGGSGTVRLVDGKFVVDLSRTTAKSVLTVKFTPGSGKAAIGAIRSGTALSAVKLDGVIFQGDIDIKRPFAKLDLGTPSAPSSLRLINANPKLAITGGTLRNLSLTTASSVTSFVTRGEVADSVIRIGVNPVNGVFDDGNDTLAANNRITKTLTIGGRLTGTSQIIAGGFPKQVKIAGQKLKPATVPQLRTQPVDLIAPALTAALAHDTGTSAGDRLTRDSTVAGTVTDVGGFASLKGGFDGTPEGSFVDLTAAVGGDGRFSLDPARLDAVAGGKLADGAHTLHLVALDKAGNRAPPVDIEFTLDATGPAAPALSLAADTGTSASDRLTSQGTLNVTGLETGASVEFSTDGGKSWTSTFTPAEGNNSVQVRQTDVAGNAGAASAAFTFILDTAAPAAPGLGLANDTGLSAGDRITRDGTLTPTGLEAGATVAYSTDGGKTWTAGFTPVAGANSVQVRQTDAAGNIGAASAAFAFTLDSQAPAAPALALTADTGTSASDRLTSQGTLTVTGLETGASVEFSTDGGKTWSAGFAAVEGANSVQVRQTDAAGNAGAASAAFTFTLDTQAPGQTVTLTKVTDDQERFTDPVANNGLTNDASPTLSGTLGAALASGETLAVFRDGTRLGTATVTGTAWTYADAGLADGQTYTYTARAEDAAGNQGASFPAHVITVDTKAPSTVGLALKNDTGAGNTDRITKEGTLTVTGLLDGATVEFSTDNGNNWLGTPSLKEGTNTVRARQIDAAGNESLISDPLEFTLDTTAPAAPGLALANDTGSGNADRLTSQGTLNVTGLETGASVEYSTDGGKTWSATFNPADGVHSVQVRQTDTAGNIGDASAPFVFTLDTTAPAAPTVALVEDTGSSATDKITRNGALTVGIEDAATVAYSTDGGQTWTSGFTAAPGANSVQVRQTDAAGNVGAASAAFTFTLDTQAPLRAVAITGATDDQGAAIANGGATGDTGPTLAGSLDAALAADEVLAVYRDGVRLGTAAVTGTAWTYADGDLVNGQTYIYTARAEDAAGNQGALSDPYVVILDTSAPMTLTAALANDTGASNTDRITSDPTLTGTLTDADGIASFKGGFDATPVGSYTDLLGDLVAGAFTLNPARLDAIFGGALPDGAHTVHLIATDNLGNARSFDLGFTLDTQAPGAPTVALAPSSGDPAANTTSAARVVLTGTAEAGAVLTLGATQVLAGSGGTFRIADVALADGANNLTLAVEDAAGNAGPAVPFTLTRQGTVTTDAALVWNTQALEAIRQTVTDPPVATRILAMVSLAQYDTLAAIEGTPAYLIQRGATGPVSTDAALAQAAHGVLYPLFPNQRASFDAALAAALAAVPDGAAKDNGRALGQAIAQGVLALRANDGSNDFVTYPGSTATGQWRPSGPMFEVADHPQWADVAPFALASPDQFRPAAPPALDSAAYAQSVEEVRSLGSATSAARTADQTQIAQFWADGAGSYTPPGHWNLIAQDVAKAQGNSLTANIRLFAQLNVALADAAIACWDAKYFHGLWRPETAIANADQDNNPATTPEADWRPLLITPPHPEYVSGHSSFSSAAATVLAQSFGANTAFSVTAYTLPGVTRNFTGFTQAAQEAGRSRIYGGIHYEFTNQAGQQLGQQVANAVLARFALNQDTQAPAVLAENTAPVLRSNLTLQGQVLDNLSGVQSGQYRIDAGAPQPLALDGEGRFTITTAFALDGSADGAHSLTILARDAAGNTGPGFTRGFILDTRAPNLALSSLAPNPDGKILLDTASRLTGSADPTGSSLVELGVSLDGGTVRNLIFDPATGAFDQPLAFGHLDVGDHALVLTARDAAGNTATLTRTVTVETLIPFTVTQVTPAAGSTDVGSTFRPKVNFSRAVNPLTLNANNLYATGPDGQKLAATIVPAQDGRFAWLFFDQPMPGGATITVHVDGSAIRAAADGAFLDADGNGAEGGELTFSFTTVNLTSVAGTKLVGRVLDPGGDLEPMTFDDIRRGDDGIIHTADDVFLLPIQGVKVWILGRENQTVFTDENGYFELTDVPAGTVKLAVDGRTATNAPASVFFPEMVMDLELTPGITNTVMSSMGSDAERLANQGYPAVYLPRIPEASLQAVAATGTTTITTGQNAAPNLTDEERGRLTLEVAAGSAIGEDGQPLETPEIGVATVPPELVRDMLPPGVLEHTFDITIQAPGVSTFAEPVRITFPNVFGAAPGSKVNILSFDHTTGRLVINGTGTVSADGLTVVSDPDSGIVAPGWHGVTPPGGCGDGGDPPPPPPPDTPQDTRHEADPTTLPLLFGESGNLPTLTWTAPDKLPDTPPPPPPPAGDCPVPPLPQDPPGKKQPYVTVTIEVDGPLADFMKKSGNLNLVSQSFTLQAGSGETKTFGADAKSYAELIPGGFKSIEENRLYGSKIKVTEITGRPDGSKHTEIKTYFIYRFLDVTDDKHDDKTASFGQTLNDGAAQTYRPVPLEILAGSAKPDLSLTDPANFYLANSLGQVWFDPTQEGDALTSKIEVKNPANGGSAGTIDLQGKGVKKQGWIFDANSFETLVKAIADDTTATLFPTVTDTDRALIDTKAERDAILASISTQTAALFQNAGLTPGIFEASAAGDNVLSVSFVQGANPAAAGQGWGLGGAIGALTAADVDLAKLVQINTDAANYNKYERAFRAAQLVNNQLGGTIAFKFDNFFEIQIGMDTADEIKYAMGMNNAHEIGHHLGLFHTGTSATVYVAGGGTDLMRQGLYLADTQKFVLTKEAGKLGLHMEYTTAEVDKAVAYYAKYQAARDANPGWYGNAVGDDGEDSAPKLTIFTAPTLGVFTDDGSLIAGSFDLGTSLVDGAGNELIQKTWMIQNLGPGTLKIQQILGEDRATDISFATDLIGVGIGPGEEKPFTIRFDPQAAGRFSRHLRLVADNGQTFDVDLTARGLSPTPQLQYETLQNNFGGVNAAAGSSTVGGIGRITNVGAQPLVISGLALTEGQGDFALSGFTPGTSITLNTDESFTFGGSFDPGTEGLRRGLIRIDSNDPGQAQFTAGVLGTGLPTRIYPQWGSDYIAIETPDIPNSLPLRAVSDAQGKFSFFLPAETAYHLVAFDPVTGLVAHGYGTTAASGGATSLTRNLVFGASTAPDTDFDGLPDDVEFAIGTSRINLDTDKDRIDDFTEIRQGLDPLGGLGVPVGIVSAARLQGTAEAVAVAGSTADPTRLTAYLATGAAGLATVDVSDFTKPKVLAELDLPGTNGDVAVDAGRALAAVAGHEAGLHLVGVADPAAPVLRQTVAFAQAANRVEIRDGIAYVATGPNVATVDVNTGEVIQTLNLAQSGGGTLVDLAFEGDTLYTLDSGHKLRIITVNGNDLAPRGSITLAEGGGKLFVGGGIAYVGAGNGGTGGYSTIDVGNPDSPQLLSGVDSNGLAGTALALNGSGLGVVVGSSSFVLGGFRALDVVSVGDPANTGNLVTRIALPEVPADVVLANGLAFVADGLAGLQIVNYVGFDTQGVNPTVSITVDGVDADPNTPGVQVLEGRTVQVRPTVADDVQVRNVELLVNGQVVFNDVAFPFELLTQTPTIAAGGNQLTLRVRVTDTGGNTALSNPVVLTIVPDTFPPEVSSISVAENANLFFVRSIDVRFDEPLDTSRLDAAGIALTRAGTDGQFGTADDEAVAFRFDTRSFGQVLSILPTSYLIPGAYRLHIDPSIITDRAGNVLAGAIVRNFSIKPASDVRAISGVPEIPQAPSANPGQEIGISVPFDPTTAYAQFNVINSSGTTSTREVKAGRVDAGRGIAYFTVPLDAATGDTVVYAKVGDTRQDFPDGLFPLQIVPVVAGLEVYSLDSGNNTVWVYLYGSGFIEDNASEYRFGSTIQTDTGGGPDVQDHYDANSIYRTNGRVYLPVSLDAASFGPITVKTAGGTSAAFTANLSGVAGTALSGTPADADRPSANPGQAVTLLGSGLTTATDVLLGYTGSDGNAYRVLLNPAAAAPDGSRATLILPDYANGVATLQVLGSASQPTVQIVPVLSSYDLSGDYLYLYGRGFVEADARYPFAGTTVTDSAANSGPDVYHSGGENRAVNFPIPVHGFGPVTVATAGGTSAPLPYEVLNPELGYLRDIAYGNGQLWLIDNGSPAKLHRIDPATGLASQSITLSAAFGSTNYSAGGLQVAPAAFTLGATAVPAGSLLLFNGTPSPDRVVAVDPATGAVIASLTLAANYDTTAGVHDPVSGHLFLLDRQPGTDLIVELDPATGVKLGEFAAPFNAGEAGLALDPVTGHLWYGSDQRNEVVELTTAGVEVRRIDLAAQGVNNNEINGLAFDAAGRLLVASSQGVVYRVDRAYDLGVARPTLTGITAASLDGTPANPGTPSANAGQVIELTGTHFGPGTQVLFPTRDNAGNLGTGLALPLAVNADGTKLQVRVPELATTGDLRVGNLAWPARNLGFSGHGDALYRAVTLSFTPTAATAVVQFADGGLQEIGDESWGLDNVRVSLGDTPVFGDDFEAGAKPEWSLSTTDASVPGVFTRFSGRFGNTTQTLNLSGLTAGQTYTLSFDLYVLDSWDGSSTSYGPDKFSVSVDGQRRLFESLSNYDLNVAQTFNASEGLRLQIVPTLTGFGTLPNGVLGSDNTFQLMGSGFMEGASTVAFGGMVTEDRYKNQTDFDVYGEYPNYGNNRYNVLAPLTLDGPVRVTTEGGYDELPGPVFGAQTLVQFTGIAAGAGLGVAADPGRPSANTGQTITLQGQGFTNQTLVQFQGVDDSGAAGTITRTGQATNDGRGLAIEVPTLARTGQVRVLGTDATFLLQIVPTLRSVGGALTAGNTVTLEGTGLVPGEWSVRIDGQAADPAAFTRRTVYGGAGTDLDQQLLTLTVPAGVGAGMITLVTAGGSVTLRPGIGISDAPGLMLLPEDVGDTLATAQSLTLGGDAPIGLPVLIGDGIQGNRDVDFYRLDLAAGDTFNVTTPNGSNFDGYARLFDAAGTAVRSVDDSPMQYAVPATGTYYLGISGYSNDDYDPNVAGSGSTGDTGMTNLTLTRVGGGQTVPPPPLGEAVDPGDTLALAYHLALAADRRMTVQATLGDGAQGSRDVDLYRVDLAAGDQLALSMPVSPYAHLRVFDAAGIQQTSRYFYSGDASTFFWTAPAAGSYYLGVSGSANTGYNPTQAGSGDNGGYVGFYQLNVERLGVGGSRLTAIDATAGRGTPAQAGTASANTGQTITLRGAGFVAGDTVRFTTVDASGNLKESSPITATVAPDGTSLTVVVPHNATTGMVRLDRDRAGLLLQIVPTLDDVDQGANEAFAGGSLTLTGSGFAETATSVLFGNRALDDASRNYYPLDVYARYAPNYTENSGIAVYAVPEDMPTGPILIRTVGGTSNVFGLSFTGLSATASSGTPADAGKPSAVPGQTITLQGSGFNLSTDIVFETLNQHGVRSEKVVRPAAVNEAGTEAQVVVPFEAVTGRVRVIGDRDATDAFLQILPVLTSYSVDSVSSDGSTAYVRLYGSGFNEGNDGEYWFGLRVVGDPGTGTGPDVYYNTTENSAVYLAVPLDANSFGPILVRTAGGASAALAVNFTGLAAVAESGTPADPNQASANPGQAITLTGTGLSTGTVVFLRYLESGSGAVRMVRLNPSAAAPDGTSATLTVPDYANGAFTVQVLGASFQPLLQVVPVVDSFDVNGNLYLYGRGFVEADARYQFAGATVTDSAAGSGPDVYHSGGENRAVNFPIPVHGFGPVTVTTAGGTSAPLAYEVLQPGLGYLRDVAFDTTNGRLWLADNANPAHLKRIDPATGQVLQTITLTSADFGSTSFFGGLQALSTAMTLNGVAVPAGSLLLFSGQTNPDRVTAVDPTTGAVIATRTLDQNYDLTAGVYDPASGHLFVLDRRTTNRIVEIDPATGAKISDFAAPFNAGEAGLALDPATGNLWYGSDQSNEIVELTTAGAEVRRIDLAPLGINNQEVNGLAFDAAGWLLVASDQGVVYRVALG